MAKQVCTGCGSTETIEEIRARNPLADSCCPERNMVVPTDDLSSNEEPLKLAPDGCNWPECDCDWKGKLGCPRLIAAGKDDGVAQAIGSAIDDHLKRTGRK